MVTELQGGKSNFDPLMAMNNHWWSSALEDGGAYLMGQDEQGRPYCPICEYEKHAEGFDARSASGTVADQMQTYCRDEGLIPKLQ